MTDKFIALNLEDWSFNPYCPQCNGQKSTASAPSDMVEPCWNIDSTKGRFTSLIRSVSDVKPGDIITVAFWAQFSTTPQTFLVEIMQSDYEKRTVFDILKNSSLCVKRHNGFRLYKIVFTATEDCPATIGLSMNNAQFKLFSAAAEEVLNTSFTREKGMISSIHSVASLMRGENYGFPACMSYLAGCLGFDTSVFDFHYFAMATGDIFTQVHRDSLNDCTDCMSDWLFDNKAVYDAFSAIGYVYDFRDKAMISGNEADILQMIKASIDDDIPVISAGFDGDMGYDFCIICGYTDDGKLKIMFKENCEPMLQCNLLAVTRGLIFTRAKHNDINLLQQYSNITRSIYYCITRKPERECTFGKDAFNAWADSIVDGGIKNLEAVDDWCSYDYNLCMAGTNGYAGAPMLKDILKNCPEFKVTRAYPVLEKVCAQFDIQNGIFMELMNGGNGFGQGEEKLRNPEKMQVAADLIRKLCDVCDGIAEAYDEKALADNDFWCTDEWRIVRSYKQPVPKCRFVGKLYKNSDRVDGLFTSQWVKWHENDWFKPLEALITDEFRAEYTDCDAYVGFMKSRNGADENYFEYWIGMFVPDGSVAPDGYDYIDIDHDCLGVCWIKGDESELYCHEGECYDCLVAGGMTVKAESDNGCYMFERYCCPRMTSTDENGECILDLCFFVDKDCAVKDITEMKPTASGESDKIEYFSLPDARVIGKSFRCPLDMSKANPIPAFWDKCGEDGLFDTIKQMPQMIPAMLGFTDDFDPNTNTFLYICGALFPAGTPVPEGYVFRDIPATTVCKGKYGEWLDECRETWENDGYAWSGAPRQYWNSELYIDGEDNDNGFRLLCAVMKK